MNIPFSSKITITKRTATTAFDRYNYAILNIVDFAEEMTVANYGPGDYFPIFDAVFNIDFTQPAWNATTQYDFLLAIWSYLSSRINTELSTGADEGMTKLRQLFAVPIFVFNNAVFTGGPLPDDLGKSINVSTVSYKVHHFFFDNLSIGDYQFVLTLDVWCCWNFYIMLVFGDPHSLQFRSYSQAFKFS
jgi:hypothetical protein